MTNNAGSRRSSGHWTGTARGSLPVAPDNQRRERRWVAAAAVLGVGLVVLLTGLVLTQGSVTLGVIVVVAGMSIVTAAVALFIGPPTDRLRRGIGRRRVRDGVRRPGG